MTDTVLVIAAHPDDEVLGMGGTLAKLVEDGHKVHIVFFTDGVSARGSGLGRESAFRKESANLAAKVIGYESSNIHSFNFPDNGLDTIPLLDLVKELETIIYNIKPCRVFTHHCNDLNIDHRIVHKATITACRPQPDFSVHYIYEFYVPSSSDWNTSRECKANTFIDITKYAPLKYRALTCYKSELRDFPHQRSLKSIEISDQYFGSMVGVEYAEPLNLIRQII